MGQTCANRVCCQEMGNSMLQAGENAPPFTARPIFGHSIAVPDGLSSQPLVLCFLPILGSPYARRTLATLQVKLISVAILACKRVFVAIRALTI